ncbi:MAG: hypothetical protein ABL967_16230 [Bryobacteraceae bacterium]
MIRKLFVSALLCAGIANAQGNLGSYLGPGVLRRGAGDVGSRGGEQVDLRFYLGANGVADTGYQGLATDAQGNLVNPGTLMGVRLVGGVYGSHSWKRARLGVDYMGDVRHYVGDSQYDNSTHALRTGYSFRPNARWNVDVRGSASEYTRAYFAGVSDIGDPTLIAPANLTDSRYYGLSADATATYQMSARTFVTFGGGTRFQQLKLPGIVRTLGFNAVGAWSRRLSARSTVGVDYLFAHDGARDNSFASDAHSVGGRYSLQLGPEWFLNLTGGVFIANIDRNVSLDLDPVLAEIFGTKTLIVANHLQKIGPSGSVSLIRQMNRSSFGFSASRSVASGAGSYTTSTSESASLSYRYQAPRKWAGWLLVSQMRNTAIGSGFGKFSATQFGTGFSYELWPSLHFVASYDIRHLNVNFTGYSRNPSSASIGLDFSPGSIPLSFR